MDYKELLESILDSKPPRVRNLKTVKGAKSNIGMITGIHWYADGKPVGIKVKFPGKDNAFWFHVVPKNGERYAQTRYIDELELFSKNE